MGKIGLENGEFIINTSSLSNSYGAELFTDPGLETWLDPNSLTNWEKMIFGTGTAGSFDRESVTIHGGTYAVKITNLIDDAATYGFFQAITGLSGNYVLKGYACNSGAGNGYVVLYNDDPRSATQIYNFTTLAWEAFAGIGTEDSDNYYTLFLTSSYTAFSLAAIASPASGKMYFAMVGDLANLDGNSIYFDDVSLKQMTVIATINVDVVNVHNDGAYITQDVSSSGIPKIFELVSVNHTGGTASTEWPSVFWNFSASKEWETGAIALQREFFIQKPAYTAVAASVMDYAATFFINGGPSGRTNMTLTNSAALLLDFWEGNSPSCTELVVGIPGIETSQGNVTERSAIKISDWSTNYFGNQTANITNIYGINIPIVNIAGTAGMRTITGNLSSLYIAGAPTTGSFVSYSGTPYSVFIDSGLSRFDGGIFLNNSSLTGVGSAITGTMSTALTFSIPDTTSGVGVDILVKASSAGGAGNDAGGSINLQPGAATGTGAPGSLNYLNTSGVTKLSVSSYGANDILIGQAATYITYFGIFAGPPTIDFAIIRTASSVNYMQMSGAITTASPAITMTGTDTDIGLGVTMKGAGVFALSGFATHTKTVTTATAAFSATYTSSGAGVAARVGMGITLAAGSTTTGFTNAFSADNLVAATSTAYNSDTSATGYCYRPSGNRGLNGYSHSSTTGHNIGGLYIATGGAVNYAIWASSTGTKNSAKNVGVFGVGLNGGTTSGQIGGFFCLMNSNTAPVLGTSAALIADNVVETSDIFDARDNNVSIFKIADGGNITYAQTAQSGGAVAWSMTPGAHTAVTAEVIDFSHLAHTITITGGYTTQRFTHYAAPTITAASGLTITNAATVCIAGAPVAAGSAVITNSYAYWVQSGAVRFDGSQFLNVTTVNAATYNLDANDYILHVTYTGTGAVTNLQLMTAQTVAKRVIRIKDAGGNAAANNITITTEGAQTIDGSATLVLNNNYQAVDLYCDGSNWFIL